MTAMFLGAAAVDEKMDNILGWTENLFIAYIAEIKEELWTLIRT